MMKGRWRRSERNWLKVEAEQISGTLAAIPIELMGAQPQA
jgi:hypothetical protein